MSVASVPATGWGALVAVSLLTVIASRRAGARLWAAWVAGLVTATGVAAVLLAEDLPWGVGPVGGLPDVVATLPWVVASLAVVAAFSVAAGGPATSPVGVVGVTVASLLAVFLEPSTAVLLPGLFLLVVAMADERYRGAAVAAVLSTAVILVGLFVALLVTGDVQLSGGPAVDPTTQGPLALLAIPGLLPVVTACLAATAIRREDEDPEPPYTYRARRTIP